MAEDFFPRRRKPKIEEKEAGFQKQQQQLSRMQKDLEGHEASMVMRETAPSSHFVHIPPHFPHEGKEMLRRDMEQQQLSRDNEATEQIEAESPNLERSAVEEEERRRKRNNNELQQPQQHERARRPELDEHFFYGNVPVLEYQLSDGTGGTLKQTPRRKK